MPADTAPVTPAITGATRLFGFIGDPVHHARSPQNFNPRLAAAGHDAVLMPLHILSETFDSAIGPIMALGNIDGLVITMPFKDRIVPYLDHVSPVARIVGAVNAARRGTDGRWTGDIFDGAGLVGAARGIGVDLRGITAGLVGAGGAGSAIALALAEAGVAHLTIHDLDGSKAARLARSVQASGGNASAGAIDLGALDLLVHATPVGMDDSQSCAIDLAGLTAKTTVIDIVTRPDTQLLRSAQALGCRTASGSAMVAAQAELILQFLMAG